MRQYLIIFFILFVLLIILIFDVSLSKKHNATPPSSLKQLYKVGPLAHIKNENLMFIAFPKTGSYSLSTNLKLEHKHDFLAKRIKNEKDPKKFYKITILRDPIEAVQSVYKFMKWQDQQHPGFSKTNADTHCIAPIALKETINTYIEKVYFEDVCHISARLTYKNYVSINNKILIDYFLHTKTLDEDLEYLANKTSVIINNETIKNHHYQPDVNITIDYEIREKLKVYFIYDYNLLKNCYRDKCKTRNYKEIV